MQFTNTPQLDIKTEGDTFGVQVDGEYRYIATSFRVADIHYRSSLHALHVFETMGALLVALASIGYFAYEASSWPLAAFFSLEVWLSDQVVPLFFLWFGLLALLFVSYRTLANKKSQPEISFADPTANKQTELPHIDVWQYATPDANAALERAIKLGETHRMEEIYAPHLFIALLEDVRIRNMFLRLSIPAAALREKLERSLPTQAATQGPKLSSSVQSILLHTYTIAKEKELPVIDVSELLMSTIIHSEPLQELLYDLELEYNKIENMLLWIRTQSEIRRRHSKEVRGASHMSKHGMDRAMTAVATPMLNSFSHDITLDVKYGALEPCVARDEEIKTIFRSIESGRANILLIGERGAGKRSIIEGIAARMVAGDVPEQLHDKRLVELSTSALVAGTTVSGAQERILQMFYEVRKSKNIILFIDNLHDLVSPDEAGLDVSEALAQMLQSGQIITFATTTPEGYTRFINRSAIGNILADVDVTILEENKAIQVLESKAPYIEYRQHVYFTYQAIEASVRLASQFLQQQVIPESAIGLMTEAAGKARTDRGENALVQVTDVAAVVSEKTGIPVSAVTDDESEKLLKLEEAMHERIVGQTEAVELVANALRRARASIRATNRPIANMLFLGPTGVGKTELAKTIADIYFGGEDRMIRLDMSEYQDTAAVYRMIGQPGQPGTGVLTEAVRQQPFSLVLLDEMEKADPDILNIFLQVFDDGRLTDSVGRVVDFTNCIIIGTSNAATAYVQGEIEKSVPYEEIQQALMHGALQEYYRPEFLNRFDGIVLFKSLMQDDIEQIASLLLKRTAKDLEEQGIGFEVRPGALKSLAAMGYDQTFGARPMRRAIQNTIENKVAELVLGRKLKRRDTVVVEEGLVLRIVPPER